MTDAGDLDRGRPEIGFGDAVRASVALGLDPVVALRVLGLHRPVPDRPATATEPEPEPDADAPVVSPVAPAADPIVPAPEQPSTEPSHVPSHRTVPKRPLVVPFAPGGPRVSGPPGRLPAVDEVLHPAERAPSTHPSLLPPGRERAILAALCRTNGPGEIDVPAVVRLLARAEPVDRLPAARTPTMRRGVQILVDYGPGMQPFKADQRAVVRAVRRLTGPESLEVLRFAGTPIDDPGTGPGPIWTWRRYRPPIDGRRVLVLSDLGCGPGHRDLGALWGRWLEFASIFRHTDRPMVCLVPVPVDRLPVVLRERLPVVTWDRSTRSGDAARAAGTVARPA